jgi:hypothetical protein
MSSQKRGTRQQLLDRLHDHGIPLGKSTLDKLCAPSIHQGPPVAAWWGRRPLYNFDEGIEWAEQRLKGHPALDAADARDANSSLREPSTKVGNPPAASKLIPRVVS